MRMMPGDQPKSFDQQVQDIAAAVHARGVFLTQVDQVVGSVEAAELCRTIRAAHEQTRGDKARHGHVKRIVSGIALKLGAKGPVLLPRASWNTIRGYAGTGGSPSQQQSNDQERQPMTSAIIKPAVKPCGPMQRALAIMVRTGTITAPLGETDTPPRDATAALIVGIAVGVLLGAAIAGILR